MTEWLTPQQIAQRTRRHIVTVRRALNRGELHGHQTTRGGRWQIDPAAADAWVRGRDSKDACCGRVVPLRRSLRRPA